MDVRRGLHKRGVRDYRLVVYQAAEQLEAHRVLVEVVAEHTLARREGTLECLSHQKIDLRLELGLCTTE